MLYDVHVSHPTYSATLLTHAKSMCISLWTAGDVMLYDVCFRPVLLGHASK